MNDCTEPASGHTGDTALARLQFLARTGELLASSLDLDETLQHVAGLAVPALGDLCIVDVVQDGELRRVGTAHVLPQRRQLMERLAREFPATPRSRAPAARVLASGTSELLEEVTPQVVASHTVDPAHAELIAALGIRSHLAVPMRARGQLVGVLSVGITESERRYTADDLAFCEEVARHAALAVDNARLYAVAQRELAERERAQSALAHSENRFRAIMEQSPLSTQLLGRDGRTIAVNAAWEALWAVRREHLGDYDILADRQLEETGVLPLLRRAFAGEVMRLPAIAYDTERTLPGRTGRDDTVRFVSAMAYPVRDAGGEVCEVVLVHEDVTERRRAERALLDSQERLQRALSGSRMNVWDWDLDTDIVSCSENAVEFWGIQIGRASDFLAVVHPDDLELLAGAARAAIEGDAPYRVEYRLRAGDGPERWVQSRGQVERDAQGRALRVLGVTQDITSRRHAELAQRALADAGEVLGRSLDYHATLRDFTQVVVPRLADWCAVDLVGPTGTLERVSVHHSDPARIALARELSLRFPPRRSDPGSAWQVIDSGEPQWLPEIPEEMLAERIPDAEHRALLAQLGLRSYIRVPMKARGGTLGVLTLVQAESGRRYGEDDVQLALDLARRAAVAVDNARLYQRLQVEDRRKDEFLATLAHELRNPLAPIRTGLALLQENPSADIAAKARAIMQRQLVHMVRLIDDLLDLSRVTRGTVELRREPVELGAVLDSALETSRPLLDGNGLVVEVERPEQPLWLEADGMRLAQVLTNLLNNAAKFTPPGGRVAVAARSEGSDVVLQVSDSGVGIEPAMLRQVFEMFVRGGDPGPHGQGGLGIGLTLVRRLVELHGGHVWADSAGAGAGSRFTVRIPAARIAPAAAPALQATAQPAGAEPRRVLVVDDNADAAETLAVLLSLDGHDVRTAASGGAALELVQAFVPELAFLDIGLPDMSGYELAQRLHALPGLAGTRLVALTGWGRDEDRRRSQEAGFVHHLTKPVDPDQVQALLAGAAGAAGAKRT